MFKVLVIAYYFPPLGLSGVQRTLKFVKYLKNYDWEPTVLTTDSTGYFVYDDSLLEEVNSSGVSVVRVGGNELNKKFKNKSPVKLPPEIIRKLFSRISNTIFIPDNKKSWSKAALLKAEELLKKDDYNLVFISGPPFSSFEIGVKLKKQYNIPLVLDYRDLWLGNQFSFYPTPLHKSAHRKQEYTALKSADKIIVTNRRLKERLMSYYGFLSFDDIYIIPHGYDPADFQIIKPQPKVNNKLKISYSGIFYEFVTPKFFLYAFKELLTEHPEIASNFELDFIGFLRSENKKLVEKLHLQEFVKAFGYLNHINALEKLMSADVLWMMVGNARNADTISSGKLYEYFGTKKPIIACLPEGALKSDAEEYGASFITEPDNIKEIKNILMRVHDLYVNNTLPKPNEEFVEKFRRDFLAEQLSNQFKQLLTL